MEQCTIEEAELVFTYLETRIHTLRKMHSSFEKSPAKLAVLRICNQLLRRCAPLPGHSHALHPTGFTGIMK